MQDSVAGRCEHAWIAQARSAPQQLGSDRSARPAEDAGGVGSWGGHGLGVSPTRSQLAGLVAAGETPCSPPCLLCSQPGLSLRRPLLDRPLSWQERPFGGRSGWEGAGGLLPVSHVARASPGPAATPPASPGSRRSRVCEMCLGYSASLSAMCSRRPELCSNT